MCESKERKEKIKEIVGQLCDLTPDCHYCGEETVLIGFDTRPDLDEISYLCQNCAIRWDEEFLGIDHRGEK